MTNIISDICRIISGNKGSTIVKGEEERLGQVLSQLIIGYAKKNPILSGFGGKYKPVAKKKNPVPISVPLMKREPYKPIPILILPKFLTHPPSIKKFPYTKRITKE